MSDFPDWEYLYRMDENRIAALEADNAAMRGRITRQTGTANISEARRCDGCKHWFGHNYCAEGVAEEADVPELPLPDFCCNRWAHRE